MNSYKELPSGYHEVEHIDLQKDKKLAILVNALGIIIMVITFIIGHLIVPFTNIFRTGPLPLLVLSVGSIAYIFLHEMVHGIFMKKYGEEKPFYGFTGMYAYAASNCYFNKKNYIVIALAPIVIWGIVLLILNLIFKETWFWVIYFIQICNLSGAAGDLYVTYRFSKLPDDILVKDVGVSMTIYAKES